ncbi:hypothetical protein ACJX0J_005413, partial [Zea mays]
EYSFHEYLAACELNIQEKVHTHEQTFLDQSTSDLHENYGFKENNCTLSIMVAIHVNFGDHILFLCATITCMKTQPEIKNTLRSKLLLPQTSISKGLWWFTPSGRRPSQKPVQVRLSHLVSDTHIRAHTHKNLKMLSFIFIALSIIHIFIIFIFMEENELE